MNVYDVLTPYNYSQTHSVVAASLSEAEKTYLTQYPGARILEIKLHAEFVVVPDRADIGVRTKPDDSLYPWHLPSQEVLNAMYEYQEEIGEFVPGVYWSSSEYSSSDAWSLAFCNGSQGLSTKAARLRVCAVRALPDNTTETERLVKYGRVLYQVYHEDAPKAMTWADAKDWCEALNHDNNVEWDDVPDLYRWHLPSREVLEAMFQNREGLGGFYPDYYWSSNELDANYARYRYFGGKKGRFTGPKGCRFLVRAVRKLPDDTAETERVFEHKGSLYQVYHEGSFRLTWDEAVRWCEDLNEETNTCQT